MKINKGKYEVFEVGEDLVYSDSRKKVKEYARKNGIRKITYKMSVDNIEETEETVKKV